MEAVTLSPKYQIVIPADVRKSMGLRPGQKIQVFEFDGRIELVPVRPIAELRGRFKGIDTTVERDEDRV